MGKMMQMMSMLQGMDQSRETHQNNMAMGPLEQKLLKSELRGKKQARRHSEALHGSRLAEFQQNMALANSGEARAVSADQRAGEQHEAAMSHQAQLTPLQIALEQARLQGQEQTNARGEATHNMQQRAQEMAINQQQQQMEQANPARDKFRSDLELMMAMGPAMGMPGMRSLMESTDMSAVGLPDDIVPMMDMPELMSLFTQGHQKNPQINPELIQRLMRDPTMAANFVRASLQEQGHLPKNPL